MFYFQEQTVRSLYRLLGFDRDFIAECRCIDINGIGGKVVSREYQLDETAFVQWARLFNGKGNCFVGRSPRLLLDREKVADFRAVTLDLDPIREKNVGATPEQTAECVEASRAILEKFNGGCLALSGNGTLLIWTSTASYPASKEFELKLKAFQNECQNLIKKWSNVKVDATQDSSRLIKLIGTVSVKGGIRATRFLGIPGNRGNGNEVLSYVDGISLNKPFDQQALLAKSNFPSRSEADYSIALFLAEKGASDDDILAALSKNPLGRNDRHDDHIRILEKVRNKLAEKNVFEQQPIVLHSPASSLTRYIDELQRRSTHEKPELPTGFAEFDKATNGLRRSEIYTVAARPAIGKSSYLINIASTLCENSRRVLIFSTEMPYQSIWDRFFSVGAGIEGQAFTRGRFTNEEQQEFDKFQDRFARYDLHILDSFQPDITAVRNATLKVRPDALFFDHIQHIGSNGNNSEVKQLSDFTRGLKSLAMETNCAVVVASQLKRPMQVIDFRTKQVHQSKPSLSDLKGCGTIEEESAFVLALYNSDASLGENEPIVTAEFLKNRFGPTVATNLVFCKNITKFKALTEK